MMDGQRARRLKCGSPIGRIIDEAGDAVQYTWVATMVGYVMRVDPGWLCLSFALINLPMYSMETKFIFTGKLSITAGGDGLGPVEMELIFALIFLFSGIFGVEGLGEPVVGSWGTKFLWKDLLAIVFILLLCLFTLENLYSSFKINFKQTFIYLLNPILTLANAAVAGYLGLFTFKYQFALFFLLH
jgi:phosphatidylglycerophosphate synthase